MSERFEKGFCESVEKSKESKSPELKLGNPHVQHIQEQFWSLSKLYVHMVMHFLWNQISHCSHSTAGESSVVKPQIPQGSMGHGVVGPGFNSILPERMSKIWKKFMEFRCFGGNLGRKIIKFDFSDGKSPLERSRLYRESFWR